MPKATPTVGAFHPIDGPERPRYRGRSTSVSISSQLLEQLFSGSDGSTGGNAFGPRGMGDHAGAYQVRELCVGEQLRAPDARRGQLGHHAISVRDQHGFPAARDANIFGQLIFQDFETDRAHAYKGSYQRLRCQLQQFWRYFRALRRPFAGRRTSAERSRLENRHRDSQGVGVNPSMLQRIAGISRGGHRGSSANRQDHGSLEARIVQSAGP